jgi:2-dehydro-3-deoxygluconokinase
VLWLQGQRYEAPTCQLDVIDRIGGGDGFAAGLIYGLLQPGLPKWTAQWETDNEQKLTHPQYALQMGWAHGALLTTFPGDVTMAKLDEVDAFAAGGSARVQR